jgi:hypothetical protein
MTTMFERRACSIVCAAAMLLAGADLGAQAPSRFDVAVHALASDAETLPPELAADALIRIAGSARVTENAWKGGLLTQAFFKAYGAHDAYRRSTPQSIPQDTRQGAALLASAMSLNRVSLQVRAAQLMAFVAPARARELFEWIDLDLAAGTCDDPLVPAVEEYYSALSLLARTTFRNNRAEALRFLELYLWRARLPSEMPAVARAVLRFEPSPSEIAYLEGLLGVILESGARDARGFSASALDIISRNADFVAAERKLGYSGIYLMDSVRDYLLKQMKGPRCSDSESESMAPPAFNAALGRVGLFYDVRRIDQPVAPDRLLGTARIDPFWQTGEARALYAQMVQLHGPGKDPPPLRARETSEWKNQAERVLAGVEQWTGAMEATPRDFLAQKSMLFMGLLDLVPPSALRTRAIRAFVDYLRRADRDRALESLWFAFVNRLLELSRGNDRKDILAAFDDAHHPALSVYAQLERLVPVGAR